MLAAVIAALAVPDIAISANGDRDVSPHSAGRCSATVPSSDKGPSPDCSPAWNGGCSGHGRSADRARDTPFLPRGLARRLHRRPVARKPGPPASSGRAVPVNCAKALRDLLSAAGRAARRHVR